MGSCAESKQMLQSKQPFKFSEAVLEAVTDFHFCSSEASPIDSNCNWRFCSKAISSVKIIGERKKLFLTDRSSHREINSKCLKKMANRYAAIIGRFGENEEEGDAYREYNIIYDGGEY